MEKMFDVILDKGEKIVKVYKPHRGKFFLSSVMVYIFCVIWVYIPLIIGAATSDITFMPAALLALFGLAALVLLYFILVYPFVRIYYNNRFYAYSNKRIIMRTGIFGVDYKSLDMAMIGAVNVYVSVIDKIYNKDTGSITFGSMASPLVTSTGNAVNPYKFSHILMPYATYKEIKEIIDEYKQQK